MIYAHLITLKFHKCLYIPSIYTNVFTIYSLIMFFITTFLFTIFVVILKKWYIIAVFYWDYMFKHILLIYVYRIVLLLSTPLILLSMPTSGIRFFIYFWIGLKILRNVEPFPIISSMPLIFSCGLFTHFFWLSSQNCMSSMYFFSDFLFVDSSYFSLKFESTCIDRFFNSFESNIVLSCLVLVLAKLNEFKVCSFDLGPFSVVWTILFLLL